jgi:osmoprotectant transport system permease protein
MNRFYTLICIFLFTLLLAQAASTEESVRIGSRDFPESVLTAEILSTALEKCSDLKVDRKFHLGGVKICTAALESSKLDIYPDYSGSLMHNLLGEQSTQEYLDDYLRQNLKEKYHLDLSPKLGFNNSFVLVVRKDFAEKYRLKSISDLANLLRSNIQLSEDFTSAFKHSFIKRSDGYKALQNVYGLDLRHIMPMEYNIALQTLLRGQVDIIDAFGTDSRLKNPRLSVLIDDRKALLAYDSVYVLRDELLKEHPQIQKVFESLANSLTNERMLELNAKVEAGATYHEVAEEFLSSLKSNGLIFRNTEQARWPCLAQPGWQNSGAGFFCVTIVKKIKQDFPVLLRALIQHINLAFCAALLAALAGIALGVSISYNAKIAKLILSINATVQTVPSLALLALLIPLVGLGFLPSLLALFIYALLPVIQNTYTGIKSIAPEYIELAQSLALNERQILTDIKLPMAKKSIIAGIKISIVVCIGTATLATFVGGGGLGDLIKAGIDLNSTYMICLGAVPAALLALLANNLLAKFEK